MLRKLISLPALPSISCFAIVSLTLVIAMEATGDEQAISFNRDIRPILSENCFHCHGPDSKTREADLRLDLKESALTVVKAGEPSKSELVDRILSEDPDVQMPPADSKKQLSPAQKKLLARWVQEGAEYEGHWSFVPVLKPSIPQTERDEWATNEIDAFILRRLQKEGLSPSPVVDRTTLIRRVALDLTGIPPTPAEIAAFVADDSTDAYEKLIDRLLKSDRYGEHMAVGWLEAARYADTDGYQNDRYRYMHVWRDWVIMAFNENKRYDQFIIEQLAGDMLPAATFKEQVATGFCRNHRINSEAGSIPAEWHVENVVDRVDTLGTVFLGLTMGCARCHDHKYDPITQKDYYRLFAFFNNVPEHGVGPNNGNSPPFINVPASWPKLSKEELAFQKPGAVEFQKGAYQGGVVRPKPGSNKTVMVMHELDEPRPTYLLNRGQYDAPDKSEVLSAAVPPALNSVGTSPKNRLELAEWLVDRNNPLTARVAVNRIWQHFFGTGLVRSADNFGSQGEPPSHPELLDWLADYFISSGWDVQALQKKIVNSSTYRQIAKTSSKHLALDPENRLLARGPRFRLTPFALRDQALYSSGLLVEKFGGPPTKPYMPPKIWRAISNNTYKQDHGENLYRRSVYTYWRRTIPPPMMTNFNAANRETCAVRTDKTNTPLQALTLMNNVVFVESSRFLAERMLAHHEQRDEQIRHGFELATGRLPQSSELDILKRAYELFLEKYTDNPKQAEQLLATGEKLRNKSLAAPAHAAMTMTASIIFNLDETINK